MGDDFDNNPGAPSSREYDFSSDFNISEVKDPEERAGGAGQGTITGGPLPKSISEAVDKSLGAGGAVPGAAKQDPFREPINKLDMEWPFATQETLSKHRDRELNILNKETPPVRKPVPAPVNLPTGLPADSTPQSAVPPVSAPAASAAPATPRPPATPASTPPVRPSGGRIFPPVPPTWPVRQVQTAHAPTLTPAPASTPAPAQSPTTQPPTQQSSASQPNQSPATAVPHTSLLKNIRTFEGDVAAALANRPVSKTSLAIAENKRRGEGETIGNAPARASSNASLMRGGSLMSSEPQEKSHTVRTSIIILLALVLMAAGAYGGYYLYIQSPLASVRQKPAASGSSGPKTSIALVPYDKQTVLTVDTLSSADIVARIQAEFKKDQVPNTIKEVVFTETKNGTVYRVGATEMLLLAQVPVPDIIQRTLQPEWMFGIYASPIGAKVPFVVVHTNLFQNAFSGMLSWEPSMVEDLKAVLGLPDKVPAPEGKFTDQIVRNKDVRAFVTGNDKTVLEYSFIDNNMLVVTADNTTLSAIITRLESRAFVR